MGSAGSKYNAARCPVPSHIELPAESTDGPAPSELHVHVASLMSHPTVQNTHMRIQDTVFASSADSTVCLY